MFRDGFINKGFVSRVMTRLIDVAGVLGSMLLLDGVWRDGFSPPSTPAQAVVLALGAVSFLSWVVYGVMGSLANKERFEPWRRKLIRGFAYAIPWFLFSIALYVALTFAVVYVARQFPDYLNILIILSLGLLISLGSGLHKWWQDFIQRTIE